MRHLLLLPVFAATLFACTSAGNRQSAASAETVPAGPADPAETVVTLAWDSIEINDTLRVDSSALVSALKIVYPKSPSALADSVLPWIASSITSETPESTPMPAESATQLASDLIARERAEVRPDFDFPLFSSGITFDFMANTSPVYSTSRFVSYQTSVYRYRGGAHGGMVCVNQVFDCRSGRRLGWNMFLPESLPEVLNCVTRNILSQFFEGDSDAMAESMISESEEIPLPSQPPLFTPDGILFIYQQYEITVYAAGMPQCIVPYADLKSFLTPEALELLDF